MTPKDKKDLFKIALITDLHMDWDYTEGMNSDCGKPLCCRHDSGLPKYVNFAAGKWGDFQCDPPPRTVENLLTHIKNEIKPDAVFWGGDSIAHNIETLTEQANVDVMINTTKLVADGLDGLPIFPTIGNHDTYPQD